MVIENPKPETLENPPEEEKALGVLDATVQKVIPL